MRDKKLTTTTTRNIKSLLPSVLRFISKRHEQRPDLIMAEWKAVIGERLAPMTKAVSFESGILTIKVRNSSLLSLLAQHERARLLKELRVKFPNATIRNIRFIIG